LISKIIWDRRYGKKAGVLGSYEAWKNTIDKTGNHSKGGKWQLHNKKLKLRRTCMQMSYLEETFDKSMSISLCIYM